MLRWRLFLGAVFIAALVGLLWLDHWMKIPGVALFPLAVVLSWLGSTEMLGLLASRNLRPHPLVVYLGSLAVVTGPVVPYAYDWARTPLDPAGWTMAALGLAVLGAFFVEMCRYQRPGEVMERLGVGVLCIVYIGLMLSFLVQMRYLGPRTGWGVPAIAALVIAVKMSDIGAYTVGRLIGRRRLAPVLSPGKTIEGALGGVAFALLGSWIALRFLLPAMGVNCHSWAWIPFGIAMAVVGMAGDLAESLIKRDLGRKDSSTWMPGFGGVLDLLDSVLYAAPVGWLFWKLGWMA
ncbi:MAG: phosphatidate cytidylyltransferase [Planctomycetia bacterium]|nr:phosphatidate cytidylyltransferase [Planctomycetia bacterium]